MVCPFLAAVGVILPKETVVAFLRQMSYNIVLKESKEQEECKEESDGRRGAYDTKGSGDAS